MLKLVAKILSTYMLRATAMLKESFATAVWQVFRLSMEETFTTCKLNVLHEVGY